MNEEELEQDDLEDVEDVEGEDAEEGDDGFAGGADDDGDSDDEAPAPVAKKAKKAVEPEELPSIEAKQKERDALARAMEEFLARGGKVQEIDSNVVADPPKKPEGKYGSRPI
ncbi:transcriptional regulator SutA [Pseudomonas sp. NW5]|uniref:transcriptional regulator SutA n=1 Tax=Pseudomonas sp. NW5 TaxID=2934934 RepID=UPI002021F565|nr:transcriptional regulator SutA [Pseudomonas sp. NW5]MCL7462744.1 hypothetical protein [Pseudomonas sp. NW5]